MSDEQKIGLNVDILIIKERKILLGKFSDKWMVDSKKYWGVPGQEVHFGESFGDAAKRYVQEEIQCELDTYVVFSVNANHAFDNHCVGVGVWATIKGEPVNAKPEDWDKWEWFGLDDLPLNIFPSAKNVIRAFKDKKVCVEE